MINMKVTYREAVSLCMMITFISKQSRPLTATPR